MRNYTWKSRFRQLLVGTIIPFFPLAVISCDGGSGSESIIDPSNPTDPTAPTDPTSPTDPADPAAALPEKLTDGSQLEYLADSDQFLVTASPGALWNNVNVNFEFLPEVTGWNLKVINLVSNNTYLDQLRAFASNPDSSIYKIITDYLVENPTATGVNLGRDLPQADMDVVLGDLNAVYGGRLLFISDSGHALYPNEIELVTTNVTAISKTNFIGNTVSSSTGRVITISRQSDGFKISYSLNAITSDNLVMNSQTLLDYATNP